MSTPSTTQAQINQLDTLVILLNGQRIDPSNPNYHGGSNPYIYLDKEVTNAVAAAGLNIFDYVGEGDGGKPTANAGQLSKLMGAVVAKSYAITTEQRQAVFLALQSLCIGELLMLVQSGRIESLADLLRGRLLKIQQSNVELKTLNGISEGLSAARAKLPSTDSDAQTTIDAKTVKGLVEQGFELPANTNADGTLTVTKDQLESLATALRTRTDTVTSTQQQDLLSVQNTAEQYKTSSSEATNMLKTILGILQEIAANLR